MSEKLDPRRRAIVLTYIAVLIGAVLSALAFQAMGRVEAVDGILNVAGAWMFLAPAGYGMHRAIIN